jgi:cytoskeleton protein RodZ
MTVGQTVALARRAAGLTVSQVAESTRVRASLIEAIEQDDFRPCGGDVYARGHLKSIATAVGLDPAEVAAAFDVQRGARKAATEPVAPVPQPTRVTQLTSRDSLGALAGTLGASERSSRRGANWTAVMALALVVVVAVGLISMLARRTPSTPVADAGPSTSPSSNASPSVKPTPSRSATTAPSSSTTTSASSSPSSTPSTSPTDVLAQADGVVVKLSITGRASWIRVTTGSGSTLYEGTLTTGQTKTFRDKTKIKLLLGNAGAVTLKVNGRDLGSPGSGGQVLKLTFLPGDPTTQSG